MGNGMGADLPLWLAQNGDELERYPQTRGLCRQSPEWQTQMPGKKFLIKLPTAKYQQ